jgi:hypothetical protein
VARCGGCTLKLIIWRPAAGGFGNAFSYSSAQYFDKAIRSLILEHASLLVPSASRPPKAWTDKECTASLSKPATQNNATTSTMAVCWTFD